MTDTEPRAGLDAAMARHTQLFLPANRADRAASAAAAGAGAVVVDLEDSVAVAARPETRAGLGALVGTLREADRAVHVVVRVNAGDDLLTDLGAAVGAGADAVLVPKVETSQVVREVEETLDEAERDAGRAPGATQVQLLVESPKGVLDVAAIADAGRRTVAMMLGTEDLATELDIDPRHPDFDLRWAHGLLIAAARAHGVAPYGLLRTLAEIHDLDALRRDAERSRAFGYLGTLCIHPTQVDVLERAFSPSEDEVAHAHRVLAVLAEAEVEGRSAARLDGRMVDTPMAQRARQLLRRAGEW